MQHHGLVFVVILMMVPQPVGTAAMDFHASNPAHTINRDDSLQEIGTRIVVMVSWENNADGLSVSGFRFQKVEVAMLPHIVQEFLFHFLVVLGCKDTTEKCVCQAF
jgi:hypothetical protein